MVFFKAEVFFIIAPSFQSSKIAVPKWYASPYVVPYVSPQSPAQRQIWGAKYKKPVMRPWALMAEGVHPSGRKVTQG